MSSPLSSARPLVLGAILAASGHLRPLEAEFAAVVYAVSGSATVTESAESPRDLLLFDWLRPGAMIQVSSGSVRIAFRDGSRYELPAGSRVVIERSGAKARSGSARKLPSVPALPAVSGFPRRDDAPTRGAAVAIRAERIAGLYPRLGAAVRADDAVLAFDIVNGASRYRVEIQDANGNPIHTVETDSARVELRKGVLKAGTLSFWTVETLDRVGSVARGTAELRTIDSSSEIRRAALAKAIGATEDPADPVLLSAVDRSLGLFREARGDLQAALERFPKDAGLCRALEKVGEPGD